ncbi:MAG: SusC/RagA family TonB-linked outer membrane protein [Bacteroidota bacterium]
MRNFFVPLPVLIATLLLMSFGQVMAQRSIRGTVTDGRDGSTLPGVNVVIPGTTTGTITDMDGNFTLTIPEGNIQLTFSMIGYSSQTIAAGNNTVFNVVLRESTRALDEVVVTGYGGTQKRSKLTNSISTVNEEVLKMGVFSNPAQALSGAVSGLRVTQSSGRPGATPTLVIRGGTNLDGSGSPLVIVDGQLRSISDINPDDIESMEVLKDAGATAIYGARANNGVLLITTKRGRQGTSEITIKAKSALNYMNEPYSFMNAEDYLYWVRTGVYNAGRLWQNSAGAWQGHGSGVQANLTGAQPFGTGNQYWDANGNPLDGNRTTLAIWSPMLSENLTSEQRQYLLGKGYREMTDPITGKQIIFSEFDRSSTAFTNPSLTQDYNISMSGGNDRGNYYAGIGYHHAQGLPVETWYQRLTFTFNADYKINNWLTSYSSFNFNDARWRDITIPNNDETRYHARMLSAPPTGREYNDAGELLLGTNRGDGNPLFQIDNFIRRNQTDKFTMGQSFKADLYRGLSMRLNANWMFDEGFYESFNKDYLNSPNAWVRTRSSSASFSRTIRQTYSAILNYDVEFGDGHSINALGGSEFYDTYLKGFSASGQEAPTDDFMDLEYTSNKEGKRSIDSNHSRSRILSFLGRVNYDYKEKYLLSLTARQDGYSILLDNRWGFFPGASAGWVISREDFMKEYYPTISFLKLRASWGLNGNVSGIGTYELQGSYGSNLYNGAVGYVLGSLPNPSLLWERSNTKEGGIDIGLFENMINLNFTYYNRLTIDKYANIPLPITSGYSSIRSNNGELRNTGIEVDLAVKVLRKPNLTWDLGANISYNRNIIEKLPENGLANNRQGGQQVYMKDKDGNYVLTWVGGFQEGQRPGGMWAFIAEGIFKDEAQVAAIAGNRIDITSGNNGSNGRRLVGPNIFNGMTDAQKAGVLPIQPGDVIWKDVNGDGTIDNYDMVYVGNRIPKWIGGLNSVTAWKGLVLSARMDFALGFKQSDAILPWFMGMMQGAFNTVEETKQTWTPENPDAQYPKYMWADQLGKRNYARESSMFIYDASYLAFREISLAYNFPKHMFDRTGIKGIETSVTGQNLGYLSSSKLYTPEVGGSVNGGYGLPRTVIFGLNLKF